MSMSDPIADMLTRIRNAQMAGREEVSMPHSRMKDAIAKVMQEEGYIEEFLVEELLRNKKLLKIKLRYYDGKPVIDKLKRMSRPGLRVYKGSDQIPQVMNGLGICVLSTSRGVMTDRTARRLKVGGELICSIS